MQTKLVTERNSGFHSDQLIRV